MEAREEGHEVTPTNTTEGNVVFTCTCGAKWKVSKKEYDAGTDHIEDHRRYAQRTATRPD